MYQTNPPRSPKETLPTMYDLPSEDPEEPGLPDEFHYFQPQLLRETCQLPAVPQEQTFIGTDLNLYYDGRHPAWYKRPDWFLVLGIERAQRQEDLRWSYVVWQETIAPFLVIELLSPGTEAEDLGQTLREVNQPPTKWQVYEQILRVPYYGIFDRYQNQFRLFQLVGDRYQPLPLPEQRFWFEPLQLGLGIWAGAYQQTEGSWLRWYNGQGDWVPTAAEQVGQEQAKLLRAAANLLATGMAPGQVAEVLGLSIEQVKAL
ncbi:MAG: Uma2 family endonuclease [Leptolyngbya sp. LCM1.Bin17]|nr:MAG: Uma2 family endonuclease [Leptolyngbya sp. LCM1.Bin17]